MILIYAAFLSNRLQYTLDEIFVNRLGLSYKHTDSTDYFHKSHSIKINYSAEIMEGCFNIPTTPFLYEEDIFAQHLTVEKDVAWRFVFFKQAFPEVPDFRVTTGYLQFDLLSAVFYLLSRYEEYLPSLKDEHNRYRESNSLAFKNGFLEIPLVDFWMMEFKARLKKQYPNLQFIGPEFKQINTIDIDFAYKYKGHPFFKLFKKSIGSFIKGNYDQNVFDKASSDPYDTYDYLISKAEQHHIETCFFFLIANYGGHDKSHDPSSEAFTSLLKNLSERFSCGIHPSYRSTIDNKALQNEMGQFEKITSKKPLISRNHFLKIKLPDTYEQLISAGIEKDYTMGYPNHVGFRASTALPFRFFNLAANQTASLWLQPVSLMDVSLKNGMHLDPRAAIQKIHELKQAVKDVNGIFVSIWHNSSFDAREGWTGWDQVYEALFD